MVREDVYFSERDPQIVERGRYVRHATPPRLASSLAITRKSPSTTR